MNKEEQKTVNELYEAVNRIKQENKILVEKFTEMLNKMNDKVDSKHIPVQLELDILQTTQASIQKAIHESLTGYNSPLIKLVTKVIEDNSKELKTIINDSFNEVIKLDEFKKSIREGFSHKIARSIISNNNGLFDKISNELKQDAVFKSKMALAVANVVNECLEEKTKT